MLSLMYGDSLHLWQKVPNCPHLMPAIALSVVPTMFSYSSVYEKSLYFTEIHHMYLCVDWIHCQTQNWCVATLPASHMCLQGTNENSYKLQPKVTLPNIPESPKIDRNHHHNTCCSTFSHILHPAQ
jgi:hypothetical protein